MSLLPFAFAFAAQPPGRFLAQALGPGEGLSTSIVYAVEVGPDGALYAGTENGVERFDGRVFAMVPAGSATAECYALATLGETLYAQCASGVWRLAEGTLRNVAPMDATDLRGGLALGPDGTVWVANVRGLWRLDEAGAVAIPGPEPWTPRAVLADEAGLWVGAVEGLYRVEGGVTRRVADAPVRALLPDPAGAWVGREDGLFRVDGTPEDIGFACFVTGLARLGDGRVAASCGDGVRLQGADGGWETLRAAEGLPGVVARDVAGDAEGNLWVAVWKQGVVRIPEPGVRLWDGASLAIEPLADVITARGELLVSGWDGAWRLGPDLRPRRIHHPEASDGDFASLWVDRAGRLAVATADGVWRQESPDRWARRDLAPPRLGFGEDGAGGVWIANPEWVAEVDGPRRFSRPEEARRSLLHLGGDGRLWLPGARRLWRLGEAGFEESGDTPSACDGGTLLDLGPDRWLGCPDGLYHREGASWTRWDGLAAGERFLSGLVSGDELWISSPTRLLRVLPSPLVLDRGASLPDVTFLPNRALARFGEWLVAGTTDGVLWLRPSELARPRRAPVPRVVAVESRGRVVEDLATLEAADSFLEVRLATDRIGDPALTRYRFRLDGGPWSTPSGGDLLQIPGLLAGDHALEIVAAAGASAWSAEPARVAFRIPQVWWARTDVRLAVLAALGLGVGLFWRERHRRVVGELASLREVERVRATFGRYVTPEIAEEALAGRLSSAGEARDVTVLFADLRGFTSLSETMPPEELVALLNAWLTEMVAAIEGEGGVVNKFVGDAVVAIFGAPRAQPDHAARGVRAARRMVAATTEVGRRLGRPLRTGVGLNSGTVIAGPVGAASRMEYTVIGEVVNVAARIEVLTRTLDADVLVTDATAERLGDHDGLRDVGEHALKGVGRRVRAWRVEVGEKA